MNATTLTLDAFQLIEAIRKNGIDDVRLALYLIDDLGPMDALKEATNDPGLIRTILTIESMTETGTMVDAKRLVDALTELQTS